MENTIAFEPEMATMMETMKMTTIAMTMTMIMRNVAMVTTHGDEVTDNDDADAADAVAANELMMLAMLPL